MSHKTYVFVLFSIGPFPASFSLFTSFQQGWQGLKLPMIGFEPRICDGESNRCTKECHKQFSFFCDNFDLLFPWTFKERSTFFPGQNGPRQYNSRWKIHASYKTIHQGKSDAYISINLWDVGMVYSCRRMKVWYGYVGMIYPFRRM